LARDYERLPETLEHFPIMLHNRSF
jgi:hypothetical protein